MGVHALLLITRQVAKNEAVVNWIKLNHVVCWVEGGHCTTFGTLLLKLLMAHVV